MSTLKGLIGAAALLMLSSAALADNANPPVNENVLTLNQPSKLAVMAGQRQPIMAGLDAIGVAKTLDNWGINVFGHVAGSYTYNLSETGTEVNSFRIFDFENETVLMNQAQLSVERKVDYRAKKFDIGFRMDWMYGTDAGIIHSDGLFDYYDGIRNPKNQIDLPQAYLDVVFPVGNGLRVRAGKFANLVGYESINPTIDPSNSDVVDFYSRSLIFFNYPFTHTGILFTYDIVKNAVTLTAGITRGDNQSTEDNNSAISFLGSLNWVINNQWSFYLSNSTGPEEDDNSRDYRTTWDATLFFRPTDKWLFALNAYYVYEENGAADGGNAQLYAVAGYGAYRINNMFTAKGRVEWIHDGDGFRLGPVEDIYEITAGMTIQPFANDRWGQYLKVRPEIRWDYSPDSAFNGRNNQVTVALDIVLTL